MRFVSVVSPKSLIRPSGWNERNGYGNRPDERSRLFCIGTGVRKTAGKINVCSIGGKSMG